MMKSSDEGEEKVELSCLIISHVPATHTVNVISLFARRSLIGSKATGNYSSYIIIIIIIITYMSYMKILYISI